MKASTFIFLIFAMFSCNKAREYAGKSQDNWLNSVSNKMYQKNDSSEFLEIEYYSNGKIKSIVEQSNMQSCGIAKGTHFYFDSIGNLEKQVIYENRFPEEGINCLDIIQTKNVFEFHSNGKIKSKYQLQSSYEGEENKIGEWVSYDAMGKESSRLKY